MPLKGFEFSRPTGQVEKNSFYIPSDSTPEQISRDLRMNSLYRDQPEESYKKRKSKPSLWRYLVGYLKYLFWSLFRRING